MLAFIHIEKAAGTSLIHILRNVFFLRYMDVRPFSVGSGGVFQPDDLRRALKMNPWLSAIGGHSISPNANLELVCPNMQYITILRDPTSRYVSHYRHWIEKKKVNIEFKEFLKLEEFWDFQTKKIIGKELFQGGPDWPKKRFAVVGVVERFDEFLASMAAWLNIGLFEFSYQRQNMSHDNSAAIELLENYGAEITERNLNDIRLYEHVMEEVMVSQATDLNLPPSQSIGHDRPRRLRRYIDFGFRKAYYEPVTGLQRIFGGLPASGSY